MQQLPDDALLSMVRNGDESAFGVLFERYRADAVRIAARVVDAHDAEDAVGDAFERILGSLRSGRGPSVSFRPYLNSAVHNAAIDRLRRRAKQVVTEPEDFVPLLVEGDSATRRARDQVVRDALAALPARWQYVLWLSEVEQLPHSEIAALMDLSPNGVAALAVRARRGLADAYLRQYLSVADSVACRQVSEDLPGYLNGTLASVRRQGVELHLGTCPTCPLAVSELRQARVDIAALIAPVAVAFLAPTSPAPAALIAATSTATSTATTAGAGGAHAAGGISAAKAVAGASAVMVATALGVGLSIWADTPPPDQAPRSSVTAPSSNTPSADPARLSGPTVHPAPPPVDQSTSGAPQAGVEDPPTEKPDPSPTQTGSPTDRSPVPSSQAPSGPSLSRLDPRLNPPRVGPSPRGSQWQRVTIETTDAQPGVKVALNATGATQYCLQTCDTVSETTTWLATISVGPGDESAYLDILATQEVSLDLRLTGTGWTDTDPSNNAQSISIAPQP